jgi:hypothetical protein
MKENFKASRQTKKHTIKLEILVMVQSIKLEFGEENGCKIHNTNELLKGVIEWCENYFLIRKYSILPSQ